MAEIKEIFKQYQEEVLTNTLTGKVINGDIKWKNEPLFITLEKKDANEMLFSIDNKPLRINFDRIDGIEIDINNSSYFSHIFWVSNYNDGNKRVEIKYLQCGNGQIFHSSLDIGFGDAIIQTKKSAKIDKIPNYLFNDYAYKTGSAVILFVETFPNSDRNFRLYGVNKRADIQVENSKWILTKETKKPFPRKYDDFLLLNVTQYDSVSFVESSKAKEAYETIKSEEAKGGTLIKLWETYSKIELERANQLKEKVGEIKFKRIRNLPDEITRVKIELNNELKTVINENRDDILNTAFEVVSESENTSPKGRFNIKFINKDYTIDLYDELYSIPENGAFNISTIGDEIVNKRRERALKNLREQRTLVTTNLRFAIEGMCDAMLEKPRKEKALTERTRRFLKDKFGIDDLTQNQKEAVVIAINTPDIAIIQGPPGTGKSTVVAAICDRLIEIAEKDKNKKSDSKLILVSAFQNDTVEHIASKIYTLGLPTIKIGKETQGNIRAEEVLIKEIRQRIDDSLQRLASKDNSSRVSKQLLNIKALYEQENNSVQTKEAIDALLRTVEINDALWNAWKEIFADKQYNVAAKDKNITLLKGVRTEAGTYNDDGFEKIQRLLNTDIPFDKEEKAFLSEDSPLDNPPTDFLIKLKEIKDKHLEKFYALENRIEYGNDLSLKEWINDAIHFFKQKEEMSYDDEDTFLTAVLESLREDLDGNTDYIRDSIKGYGESLAATNQVAGGHEMSSYRTIDNIILEEAARSNPLDLIIPMSKATERIIMVGDQNQLPHLLEDDIADETAIKFSDEVKSVEARKKLEESLFGVIFRNLEKVKPKRKITLTEQFRMHPVIGNFISKIYYGNELKQGMTNQAEKKLHNLSLGWAKDKVTVFCDVNKQKGLEQNGKSKSRQAEAVRIISLLDELKNDANFENISVGIITFYAKQVELLFNEAAKKGYAEQNTDGSYEISRQYRETQDGREKLRIGSVDSFQGKEFDIVILSTVRSNDFKRTHENYKKVFGFLTLQNRLNVAFSRAQKLIIVVGDGTMFADEFAKTYVEGLHEFYTQLSLNTEYGNRIQ